MDFFRIRLPKLTSPQLIPALAEQPLSPHEDLEKPRANKHALSATTALEQDMSLVIQTVP